MCVIPLWVAEPTDHSRTGFGSRCSNEPIVGEEKRQTVEKSVLNWPNDDANQSGVESDGGRDDKDQSEPDLGVKGPLSPETKGKRKFSVDSDQLKATAKGKENDGETDDGETKEDSIEPPQYLTENERVPTKKAKRTPETWTTTSTVHTSSKMETETNLSDDLETSLTKAVNVTITEDTSKRDEAEDDEDDDDQNRMVFSGSWDLVERDGRPGLRVLASCSIHRQENITKTVITAESDVGDEDDKSTASIVHFTKTVEVEEYKGLISDDEDDKESAVDVILRDGASGAPAEAPKRMIAEDGEPEVTKSAVLTTALDDKDKVLCGEMDDGGGPRVVQEDDRYKQKPDETLIQAPSPTEETLLKKLAKKSVSFDDAPEVFHEGKGESLQFCADNKAKAASRAESSNTTTLTQTNVADESATVKGKTEPSYPGHLVPTEASRETESKEELSRRLLASLGPGGGGKEGRESNDSHRCLLLLSCSNFRYIKTKCFFG
ncbi:nuclear autoantigenic sperm protein-like [Procambarus clarkii]|uniref:nuclear autoantigenic sperm protein-like n=1 Tax=Procambarus clarkii TaxID=6728 RepID=UPI0037446BDB